MSATATPAPNVRPSNPHRSLLFLGCVMLLLWLATGCNDYPLLLLEPKPYLEITDRQKQSQTKAVDILFVVDNSQSMQQEQDKLARNFKAFIEALTKSDVGNYQIGIISTDMSRFGGKGKLEAKESQPRIISRLKLSAPAVIKAFQANINLGTNGNAIESPLSAMRAALSADLLNDTNKGFLRPGALLAVIFVGDEDDCSHDGRIDENAQPGVCNIPSTVTLKEPDGSNTFGPDGKPLYGQMDKLTPVSEYIKFLKSLKRDVVVTGIIGNPHVYRDLSSREIVDPDGGCGKDLECSWQGQNHFCGYNGPNTRRCGGCVTGIDPKTGKEDANAAPGYRLYEVIKAFGGSDNWFPICGNDEGFRDALLRQAGLLIARLIGVRMTRKPQDTNAISVKIVYPDGREPTAIAKAKPTGRACDSDKVCGAGFLCGQDNQCYGDGWVYYINNQPLIKLSGNALLAAAPGTEIQANYVAENLP